MSRYLFGALRHMHADFRADECSFEEHELRAGVCEEAVGGYSRLKRASDGSQLACASSLHCPEQTGNNKRAVKTNSTCSTAPEGRQGSDTE